MTLKALRVVGPFYGPSGYENHVRESVRALVRAGIQVQLIDLPEWASVMLPPDMSDQWFESLSAEVDARVTLHFCIPTQLVPHPNHINAIFTMFEANRIPDTWVEASQRANVIILPTESSRIAWVESGVPRQMLRLCPEGVDSVRFSGNAEPLPLGPIRDRPLRSYAVRFLNVSDIVTRKNLSGLIRTWLRATTPHDDAVLIVKITSFAAESFEYFHEEMRAVETSLGKTRDKAAPIHIVQDFFSDTDMPRLYTTATHYISMSFGEGWDLPMMEAGASGLTLVAPEHSAYCAYLDSSTAHLIPVHQEPAVCAYPPGMIDFFKGASWWVPDEDAAVEIVGSIVTGTAPPKRSIREWLVRDFTWDRATQRLIDILDAAQSPRRRWFWRRA